VTLRFAALMLCLIACGGPPGDRLSTAVIDTAANGVIHVTNAGPTQWAGTDGWRLVAERVIRPAIGDGHEIIEPMTAILDATGTLYVMEREPPALNVYAPDGRWVRSIGAVGDGPGEFRRSMLGIVRDTLVVHDPVNARLTLFGTDGTVLGMAPAQCCFRRMEPITMLDDGTLVLTGQPASAADHQALFLTRLDGSVIDTAPADPIPPPDQAPLWRATRTTPQGVATRSMPIPNQPQAVFRWRGDGTRVLGHTGTYRLVLTSKDLDTLRVITAPAPTVVLTTAQRDSLVADVIADAREDWREALRAVASVDDVPTTLPAWLGVIVDPSGRLWVGRPGAGGAVAWLDVFDPDGVFLGTVAAPSPAVLNGHWSGDRLLVTEADADGFKTVTVYRLERGRP
jgi:hypothetical protein